MYHRLCAASATSIRQCLYAAVYLTADDVIAATRDTMEATLDYLEQKYGHIDVYCREVRLSQALPGCHPRPCLLTTSVAHKDLFCRSGYSLGMVI